MLYSSSSEPNSFDVPLTHITNNLYQIPFEANIPSQGINKITAIEG